MIKIDFENQILKIQDLTKQFMIIDYSIPCIENNKIIQLPMLNQYETFYRKNSIYYLIDTENEKVIEFNTIDFKYRELNDFEIEEILHKISRNVVNNVKFYGFRNVILDFGNECLVYKIFPDLSIKELLFKPSFKEIEVFNKNILNFNELPVIVKNRNNLIYINEVSYLILPNNSIIYRVLPNSIGKYIDSSVKIHDFKHVVNGVEFYVKGTRVRVIRSLSEKYIIVKIFRLCNSKFLKILCNVFGNTLENFVTTKNCIVFKLHEVSIRKVVNNIVNVFTTLHQVLDNTHVREIGSKIELL